MTTTNHPSCDLPVGTIVLVTPFPSENRKPFRARIVGTDLFGSKYQIGAEQLWRGSGYFGDGGQWTFPGQVQQLSPVDAPDDWEPEACYCHAVNNPPCAWCTSGGDEGATR